MKTARCCICGKEFEITDHFWGHNPEPVQPNIVNGKMNVCCTDCNQNVVIPERLKAW